MDDTTRKIMHSRGQCISQIVNGIDGRVEKYGELFGDDIRRLVDVSIEPYKDIFSDDDVYQVENYVDSYIGVLQSRRNVPVYRYTSLKLSKVPPSKAPVTHGSNANNGILVMNSGQNAGHTVAKKFKGDPTIMDLVKDLDDMIKDLLPRDDSNRYIPQNYNYKLEELLNEFDRYFKKR